jgi:hypothetical protein
MEQITTQETAVQTTTDSAAEVIPAVNTATAIDQAKMEELTDLFLLRINNPRFWENANRIIRLEAALVLPMFDDPSMRMFYDSAKDELLAKEFKQAMLEKRVPVEPSENQIIELAEQKHYEKYVAMPARKAERAAARAARAAQGK